MKTFQITGILRGKSVKGSITAKNAAHAAEMARMWQWTCVNVKG